MLDLFSGMLLKKKFFISVTGRDQKDNLDPKIANLRAGAAEINENQSKYVSVSPKTNKNG